MFKFIHSADIHLDSPLKGLMRFEGAPVERIQSATRDAFRNLIQLALDERVAFVLIAGDLWDCDWQDAGPGLFFISQVARLDKAGIAVYLIKGNHDAHSQLTTSIRKWPDNVKWFSHKAAHTEKPKGLNVAIHGQSYPQQHVHDDLSETYPAPVPGAFNIGMLHTCLEDGGTDYAPACVDKLIARGYDYWALGHIHNREDFSRDGVHIEIPGNLQGRSTRETGPKGCTVVTVADDHAVTTRFETLDVVRWQVLSISCEDAKVESEVRRALGQELANSDGRLLVVRLHIIGSVARGQALRDRLDAIAAELGDIWIEKILVDAHPRPPRAGDTVEGSPLNAEISEVLAELEADDNVAAEWIQEFAKLREQLTGEMSEFDPARAMQSKQAFRTLVTQVVGVL